MQAETYLSVFTLIYSTHLTPDVDERPELLVVKQTLEEQLQGGGTSCLSCCSQKSRLGTHPAPVERPGKVISCSQRKNSNRRLGVHLQLIECGQDPPHLQRHTQSISYRDDGVLATEVDYKGAESHRAVTSTGEDPQVWHFAIQLQPGHSKSEAHRKVKDDAENCSSYTHKKIRDFTRQLVLI